jgi:quinol-cytochrome oxidoreductase complex cytochrome b subunit
MMATFASDPNLDAYLPPGAAPATTDRPRAESRGALGWLDDRLGLSAIRYAVPEHANTLWYTLGGITFVGILVLVATGAWLGQYYNPDPTGARESVIFIQNEVPLGDVIRGIHVWTAYLVVITAALHLLRVFVTASYKVPREINWLVGLALLGLLLFGAVFTGTILRWDQEAYEAMVHNMEAVTLLGGLGGFFSHAFTTSVSMLARLYVAHVSIIPLAILLLLIVHLFLIKHHGISPTPAQAEAGEAPGGRLPKEKQLGHYPSHLRLMVGYGLALLGLAGMLGVVFPQPVGPAPDPTLEVTKPPFVFYWLYPFEDWFGVSGIVYAGAIVFGLLAILPFADRSSRYRLRRRPLVAIVGLAMLVMILVLSIMTAIAPTARHLS